MATTPKTAQGLSGWERFWAFLALLSAIVLAGCTDAPPVDRTRSDSIALRIATYNVHYLDLSVAADEEWGLDNWRARRAPLARLVAAMDADIVAFQEVETYGTTDTGRQPWLSWLLQASPQYKAAATQGPGAALGQPIFYRPGTFQVLDEGHRFFSDPDGRFRVNPGLSRLYRLGDLGQIAPSRKRPDHHRL